MLHDLRATVTTANELVVAIGDQFKHGEADPEQTARLAVLVATLELQVAKVETLPSDLRAEIAGLLTKVQTATMIGGGWLEAVAADPELANLHMRTRVRKVYGATTQDDSSP